MTRSAGEVTEFAAGADGLTPLEIIERSIYFIRHQKVMVDFDLATLYQVPTKALNQAVRRNLVRFPNDFMFQLTARELGYWKSQTATSNRRRLRRDARSAQLAASAGCRTSMPA